MDLHFQVVEKKSINFLYSSLKYILIGCCYNFKSRYFFNVMLRGEKSCDPTVIPVAKYLGFFKDKMYTFIEYINIKIT